MMKTIIVILSLCALILAMDMQLNDKVPKPKGLKRNEPAFERKEEKGPHDESQPFYNTVEGEFKIKYSYGTAVQAQRTIEESSNQETCTLL